MSAFKHLFIFYNSFSLLLTENLHKHKHFLKTLSTILCISFFCKIYNKEKLFTYFFNLYFDRSSAYFDRS